MYMWCILSVWKIELENCCVDKTCGKIFYNLKNFSTFISEIYFLLLHWPQDSYKEKMLAVVLSGQDYYIIIYFTNHIFILEHSCDIFIIYCTCNFFIVLLLCFFFLYFYDKVVYILVLHMFILLLTVSSYFFQLYKRRFTVEIVFYSFFMILLQSVSHVCFFLLSVFTVVVTDYNI